MSYELRFDRRALKDFRRLDGKWARLVRQHCEFLAERAEVRAHKALKPPFQGSFSLRVGDYRAIYMLDHSARQVIVIAIAHRSVVYDD